MNRGYFKPFIDRPGRTYKKRAYSKRGVPGVYLIRENGVLVYIGMSKVCVCEALYRHFYRWTPTITHKGGVSYWDKMETNDYEVNLIELSSSEAAIQMEAGFIFMCTPRDNRHLHSDTIERKQRKLNINNNQESKSIIDEPPF